MATIDIRSYNKDAVDKIVFANSESGLAHAVCLFKDSFSDDTGRVRISGQNQSNYTYVNGKEEVINLIKALQKTIELNWVS